MAPYERPSVQEWLNEASAELGRELGVPVKIYALQPEPQAENAGPDLKADQLRVLARTGESNPGREAEVFRTIGCYSAGRHLPVVGDLETMTAGRDLPELRSILVVPIFNPNVFQPSPVTRPLLGVLAFGTSLTAEAVVKNLKMHLVAQNYAELVAKSILDLANPTPSGNVAAGI